MAQYSRAVPGLCDGYQIYQATAGETTARFCAIQRFTAHCVDQIVTIAEIVMYLRELAQPCVRCACACPRLPSSRGFEEVTMDLTVKAKELEDLYGE